MKANTHTFDYVKAIPLDPNDVYWDNQFGPTSLSGNGDLPVYASVVDGNDLYFAGDFLYAGGLIVNHIVKWDGTQWSALGTGMNDRVTAISFHNGILYVGDGLPQPAVFQPTILPNGMVPNGRRWEVESRELTGGLLLMRSLLLEMMCMQGVILTMPVESQ